MKVYVSVVDVRARILKMLIDIEIVRKVTKDIYIKEKSNKYLKLFMQERMDIYVNGGLFMFWKFLMGYI